MSKSVKTEQCAVKLGVRIFRTTTVIEQGFYRNKQINYHFGKSKDFFSLEDVTAAIDMLYQAFTDLEGSSPDLERFATACNAIPPEGPRADPKVGEDYSK